MLKTLDTIATIKKASKTNNFKYLGNKYVVCDIKIMIDYDDINNTEIMVSMTMDDEILDKCAVPECDNWCIFSYKERSVIGISNKQWYIYQLSEDGKINKLDKILRFTGTFHAIPSHEIIVEITQTRYKTQAQVYKHPLDVPIVISQYTFGPNVFVGSFFDRLGIIDQNHTIVYNPTSNSWHKFNNENKVTKNGIIFIEDLSYVLSFDDKLTKFPDAEIRNRQFGPTIQYGKEYLGISQDGNVYDIPKTIKDFYNNRQVVMPPSKIMLNDIINNIENITLLARDLVKIIINYIYIDPKLFGSSTFSYSL